MFKYKGGQKVREGTYWDVSNGRRVDVEQEATLEGDSASTYYRVSSGVMLLAGPVLGLLYVILLPFIGIATVGSLLVRKVFGGLFSLIARSLSFGWRPKEAYLSGKKKDKKKNDNNQ